ncbi:hypothetical protein AA23498_2699 [Acetobacter nitrogenifigens DSM 23921 = NBRC 105050]|uniref:Uncharacterized protein n=1 Tax=Acetobacter nitrogenifigens DSM 23921 = NBRC 105050 TaxID=1120919 RepID=A0A511XEU6_9PROT|nr:hypothetical protein [Acetobacter nitrogenifigens]GBQ96673.1 hypothetical protein AA23498_2699 [Acetobacter nitrogenifigens DSM 23921 = NBRC 105050]GEN61482.1 hypothetical protein ANI02nite_33660 [Acetobacter nitrogenifigens DSM 23921 = NBRC 105050]
METFVPAQKFASEDDLLLFSAMPSESLTVIGTPPGGGGGTIPGGGGGGVGPTTGGNGNADYGAWQIADLSPNAQNKFQMQDGQSEALQTGVKNGTTAPPAGATTVNNATGACSVSTGPNQISFSVNLAGKGVSAGGCVGLSNEIAGRIIGDVESAASRIMGDFERAFDKIIGGSQNKLNNSMQFIAGSSSVAQSSMMSSNLTNDQLLQISQDFLNEVASDIASNYDGTPIVGSYQQAALRDNYIASVPVSLDNHKVNTPGASLASDSNSQVKY